MHRGIAISCNLAALRISQNIGGDADPLALAQAFIADEEEGVISPDRAAHSSAEVIALERRHCLWALVEEITRIERIIAQEIEDFSVNGIRARAGSNVHYGAGVAAVFRAWRGVIHLEFGDGIDRRLECDLAVAHVNQVHAVDHKIRGAFASSGGVHAQRALA